VVGVEAFSPHLGGGEAGEQRDLHDFSRRPSSRARPPLPPPCPSRGIEPLPAEVVWHARRVDRTSVKRALVAALLAKLEEELATMRRAAKDAREAATHEEAKPENDKDTRALEASYLAGAQAARVRELEGEIKATSAIEPLDLSGKTVQASAVVTVEDEDEARSTFFFAPFGGGVSLSAEGVVAQVVTPQSPLGKALFGRAAGDVIEVRVKGATREMTIVDLW